jgi:hypothetical protein
MAFCAYGVCRHKHCIDNTKEQLRAFWEAISSFKNFTCSSGDCFGKNRLAMTAIPLTQLFGIGKLQTSNSFQGKETRFMFKSKSVLVSDTCMGASLRSS